MKVFGGFDLERIENSIDVCPGQAQGSASGGAREMLASNIMLLSTIVTVSQIKFTLICLLNSLLYFYEMNDNILYGYLLHYYLILF